MNLKNLLMINAILAWLFGLAFVLMPADTLGIYGLIILPVASILMARLFGGALLGLGTISWFAQSSGDSDARSAILLGFIVADGVGFFIAFMAQLDGVVNNFGWSTVAIYLLIGLGFAYYRFSKGAGQAVD